MGGFFVVIAIFAACGAVYGIGLWMQHQRKQEKLQILRDGVRILGWIVQANTMLFQPGPDDYPAQVLITFDDVPKLPEYLEGLARKLGSLKSGYGIDATERAVAKLVKDETFVYGLRVKLPPEFTGGPTVYSCHVIVERRYLIHHCLKQPFIECVAMPGDKGVVCMVPYEMFPEFGVG